MSVTSRLSATALPRVLAGINAGDHVGPDLASHDRVYGPPRAWTPDRLIDEVQHSGLRGRGGADFPTARKLASVAARRRVSAVVVNGSETEPASAKDRVLMTALPHLVLDGAVTAADAVGAAEVIVVLGHRATRARPALKAALAERDDTVPVRVVGGGDGYVSGEESAVINWLEHGVSLPTATPPRPFERGYRGRPTLVQNPETLAQLALVARFGARWFRALGTPADPGSVLVTVSGAVRSPGVCEVAFGTPLREVITIAGGSLEPVRAVLVGGYFGTWADRATASRLLLARETLRSGGYALGAGVLIVLGESACGLHESAALVSYLAGQSAGQCGPCVFGLSAIADGFAALVDGRGGSELRSRLERWTRDVEGRGACHHPNGVARLVRSALDTFGEDLARHGRRCAGRPAGLPEVSPTRRARRP